MGFKTDIEIAQECTMEPITKIAEKAGIDDKYLEQYGKYRLQKLRRKQVLMTNIWSSTASTKQKLTTTY